MILMLLREVSQSCRRKRRIADHTEKATKGASKRQRYGCLTLRNALSDIEANDDRKNPLSYVSNLYKIHPSVLSKAKKRKDFIFGEAGHQEAARVLGQKYRPKKTMVVKYKACTFREELDDMMLRACRERNKNRRVLSLKWAAQLVKRWTDKKRNKDAR